MDIELENRSSSVRINSRNKTSVPKSHPCDAKPSTGAGSLKADPWELQGPDKLPAKCLLSGCKLHYWGENQRSGLLRLITKL